VCPARMLWRAISVTDRLKARRCGGTERDRGVKSA
jgi:hypothetical protein